ncbi:FG-GAP repeat domain-containing protein [[Eubacterium] cellulosolvens]
MNLYYFEIYNNDFSGIRIDGEFDDWKNVKINSDENSDQENNINVDLIGYSVLKDDVHCSFYLEVYGEVLNGVKKVMNSEHVAGLDTVQIFLDTDANPGTGYYIKDVGADYLLEASGVDNSVHSSSLKKFDLERARHDWNGWFTKEKNIRIGLKGKRLEAQIPVTILQNPDSKILALFHTQDSAGNEDFSDFILCSEPGVLKVTQNSIATTVIKVGECNVEFLDLTLKAEDTDVSLDRITLTGKGTFTNEDIASLKLFHDEGNGVFDDLDHLVGEGVFSTSREIEFEFDPPLLIEKRNSPFQLIAALDVSANARSGHVIGLGIDSSSAVGINNGAVTIETENTKLSYIGTIPAKIVIDGAFCDWENTDVYFDTDAEEINNENIDVNRYRIARDEDQLSFYFDVNGTMMAGVSVPVEPKEIIQRSTHDTIEYTIQSQNIEINNIAIESLERDLPPRFGEDTAQIFIDLDNNYNTGYSPPNGAIGAELMIEIIGKHNEILSKKMYQYSGDNIGAMDWHYLSEVDAICNNNELEAQIGLDSEPLTNRNLNIYFFITGWDKTEHDDYIIADSTPSDVESLKESISSNTEFVNLELEKTKPKVLKNDLSETVECNEATSAGTSGTRGAVAPFSLWSSKWNSQSSQITDITTDDLDGDGYKEIICCEDGGYVYVFESGSTLDAFPTTPTWKSNKIDSAKKLTVGDADRDNRKEIAVANWSGNITVFEYPGSGDISTMSKTPTHWLNITENFPNERIYCVEIAKVYPSSAGSDVQMWIGTQNIVNSNCYMNIYNITTTYSSYYEGYFNLSSNDIAQALQVEGGGDITQDGNEDVAWGTADLGNGPSKRYGEYVAFYQGGSISAIVYTDWVTNADCEGVDIYDIDEDGFDEAVFGVGDWIEIISYSPWNRNVVSVSSGNTIMDIDCGDQDHDGDPSVFIADANDDVIQLEHTGAAGTNTSTGFTDRGAVYTSDGNDDIIAVHCSMDYDSDSKREVVIGEAYTGPTNDEELFVIETPIPEFSSILIPISFCLIFIAIFTKITTYKNCQSSEELNRKLSK